MIWIMKQMLGLKDDDECFTINNGGTRALLELNLIELETFWLKYGMLLDEAELYDVMIKGYLLPIKVFATFHDSLSNMMVGKRLAKDERILYYLKALNAHHRALEERKKRHWRALMTAVFLNSFIHRYIRSKFAPGSQEMQRAQTRFETGDYQV